jgi:hypothetical protein
MKTRSLLSLLVAVLLLAGCNYDFPLTEQPTHGVDARLLGHWVAHDPDNGKEMVMNVRRLDDTTYVIGLDDDLYRAFHSDFAGLALVSVQDLQEGGDDRKYVYFQWQLSADGTQLTLRGVSPKVVPEETKTAAEARRLVEANRANPALFRDALVFSHRDHR